MYVFFHENLPFFGEDELEMDIKSKNDPLEFAEDCPDVLKDAIEKMTRKDWKKRISIDQAIDILRHTWFPPLSSIQLWEGIGFYYL